MWLQQKFLLQVNKLRQLWLRRLETEQVATGEEIWASGVYQFAGETTANGTVDLDSRAKTDHDSQCFSSVPPCLLLSFSQIKDKQLFL